jgi:hypothetical protein
MKLKTLICLAIFLLIISLIGFQFIDIFTFKPRANGTVSGNGNLGMLVILLVLPFYIALNGIVGYLSYRLFGQFQKPIIVYLLFSLMIILLFGFLAEYLSIRRHHFYLGGGPDHPGSIIYMFGWFNQYTNTIFFNYATFSCGLMVSMLVGGLTSIIKRRPHTNEYK